MSYNFNSKINNILTESQYSSVFNEKLPDVISSVQWELTIDDGIHFMTNEYTTNFNLNVNQFITTTELSPEDRKSTRLNSSHVSESRMPSSA